MNKRLLLVSYDFPPTGGGGVQRNVKFLKYLSRLGWDTSVLTVRERPFFVYDESLLKEVEGSTIFRSMSLDPVSVGFKVKKVLAKVKSLFGSGSVETAAKLSEGAWYVGAYRKIRDWTLLPDGACGWIPFANRLGYKIARSEKPDILLGTFPGPSNAFVTYNIAKKFKIPYVLDFRDAWLDDPYTTFPSAFHRYYHAHYEKKIVLGAAKVIVYGDPLKEILELKYPVLKGKVEVITNGFDPEDLDGLVPVQRNESKVRLVYSGAVYIDRRETFVTFIGAVCTLPKHILEKLEVIFVGDKLAWTEELVASSGLKDVVRFTGYLPHKEALNYLSSADAALMFLKKGDTVALTGKIFEYIGLGLPIIACVEPLGACATLLSSINHAQGVCSPSSTQEIASRIIALVNGELPALSRDGVNVFSRKYHTERLSQLMSEIT